MTLEIVGGRGTTGRLSTFRALAVNVAAILLLAAYAVMMLVILVVGARLVTR